MVEARRRSEVNEYERASCLQTKRVPLPRARRRSKDDGSSSPLTNAQQQETHPNLVAVWKAFHLERVERLGEQRGCSAAVAYWRWKLQPNGLSSTG